MSAHLRGDALAEMQSAAGKGLKIVIKKLRKRFNPQSKYGRLNFLRRLLNEQCKSGMSMANYMSY